jgi:hypothetical protein
VWISCLQHNELSLGMLWGNCYVHCRSCYQSINMSTPLLDSTIAKQHAVIQFLWSEGVKPSKIHRRMLAQHRENYITQRKVYQWMERFQSGTITITDEHHSSHSQKTVLNELMIWMDLVQEDRLLLLI